MSRHFGITARSVAGGVDQPSGPHYAQFTQRVSDPLLPSGSILKPFEVSEPPSYKFQMFESALFVITTAAALVVALALLFVDLG